jgi:hypothetical protein
MGPLQDRMPPLVRESMDELQRAGADELIAGPRKGVKGPFILLLRSPCLTRGNAAKAQPNYSAFLLTTRHLLIAAAL